MVMRVISASTANRPPNDTEVDTEGRLEPDSHADTTVAGANMRCLAFTGQTCTVKPFTDKYEPVVDVPMVTAATAFDHPRTGETIILMFHQALWFGTLVSNSLIAPNQVRSFGYSLCDDPYDPHRDIGIQDQISGTEIKFNVKDGMVGIDTRCPSLEECYEFRRIILTSDEEWDPRSPHLQHNQLRSIDAVTSLRRPDPFDEFDTHLRTVSSVLTNAFARDLHETVQLELPDVRVGALTQTERHAKVRDDDLARRWNISIPTARQTLKVTTQMGVRYATEPLHRRYKTNLLTNSNARRLTGRWYADTLHAPVRSIESNVCAEVFTNTEMVSVYPQKRKAEVSFGLDTFIDDVGAPETLILDNAGEQTGHDSDFMKIVRKNHIGFRNTEPHSPWQNRAEDAIKKIKHRWKRLRRKTNCHRRLWDYGMRYEAELLARIAGADGRTPLEKVTGDTPDISEYLDFDFYDPVWYLHETGEEPQIGRWLGIAHRTGGAMCYFVLTQTARVLRRTSVQHMTEEDLKNPVLKKRLETFDETVHALMDDPVYHVPPSEENGYLISEVSIEEEEEDDLELAEKPQPDVEDYSPDTYDQYIGARILIPGDGERITGRVTKRVRGEDGNPIGRSDPGRPWNDTRRYQVEMSDGRIEDYAANVIAENLFSQCDEEGNQYMILKDIVDHKSDETAVSKEDGTYRNRSGTEVKKKTTKGWKLLVEWNDGTKDWIPLSELKESNPIKVAEYAVANRIHDEPAFAWWVPHVLRKRTRIINKVKSRYWRATEKFGIELPHSVQEAYEIDRRNGTLHWTRAIEKEMKKIRELGAFEKHEGCTPQQLRQDATQLPGHAEIGCHMVFDIKMDGEFTRKARFVANGNETHDLPKWDVYASVVSRETVRIAFLYAALNDLSVLSCDIANAYLNAPCAEKLWTLAGPEFGEDAGAVMILKKAVYGLQSAGNSWRSTLHSTLEALELVPSRGDPNLYMRRVQDDPIQGDYYEFVLVYVDDLLCISGDPKSFMDKLGRVYDLKDSVKPPERYLGANVDTYVNSNGQEFWSLSSNDYVQNAVKLVKGMLEKEGLTLPTSHNQTKRPMDQKYRPELDVSPELDPVQAQRYQQLIGMLRWACELGRVDIMFEVSLLSSHLALPREGHLEAAYGIFAYLNKHDRSRTVMDCNYPAEDPSVFYDTDWSKSVYTGAHEEIPADAPEPLGNPVVMSVFVDASHAGDLATRRSHTGILIYLNKGLVDAYSKKQNTVEMSTFGSELVALRVAMERVKALRIKLRLMGIPMEGPTNIFCDNESVCKSTSNVESRLNKKHQAICWHAVREACAGGWMRVGKEPTETNTADLLTKALDCEKRFTLLRNIYY